MIFYQLPNGKTVKLTAKQFEDLDDDLEAELMYGGYGEEFNDPWIDSPIQKKGYELPPDWEFNNTKDE